jgi:hypothetical protein
MTLYKHGEQTFAIIDGELWAKVQIDNGPEIQAVPQKRTYKKRNSKTATKTAKKGKRGTRKFLTPEQKDLIRADLAAGKPIDKIMAHYGVSYPTVYRLKGNSGEPLKLSVVPRGYVCPSGHRFKSKFPITHARCPDCHQLANVPDYEPEIEEGEV